MPSPSGTSSFSRRARSYSRPQTPTRGTSSTGYTVSPSRGKPKVLPFPDLSVPSVSRDASRTTSPSETPPLTRSPRGSQSGSSSTLGLASLGLERTGSAGTGIGIGGASGSGSGYFGSRDDLDNASPAGASSASAAGSGTNTPIGTGSGGTTTPRSPLGRPSFSFANQPFHAGTRSRSLTAPDDMSRSRSSPVQSTSALAAAGPSRPQQASGASTTTSTPTPPSILMNPIVTTANPTTTRVEGFNPVPLSPTTTIRPSSVPTNINIAPPLPPPLHAASSSSRSAAAAAATITLPPTPVTKAIPSLPSPSSSSKHTMTPLTIPLMSGKIDLGLSDHLRQSFMKGTCADVRIWVRKWGVGWPVHRMVLVQAGFFHSLFMMGFSEMGARPSRKGKERVVWEDSSDWTGEDIELQFDDPNITRTAFEICLSRLYSGYPEFRLPAALVPTPCYPLSPVFSQHPMPDYRAAAESMPPHSYLATPRLLLSLLATTNYLGQTGLMNEVLHTILRTIGPATLRRYLNFAIGDGIGEEEWDGQTGEAAHEIEHVARRFTLRPADDDNVTGGDQRIRSARSSTDSTGSNTKLVVEDDEEFIVRDSNRRTSRPSPLSLGDTSHDEDADNHEGMPHFYGFPADKIGEACCCFLSRWGLDILNQEIKHDSSSNPNTQTPWRVFAAGGIHAKFLRALLSSDALFVKNEMERYQTARKVLDLRRRDWEGASAEAGDLGVAAPAHSDESSQGDEEWEEDEVELEKVFTDGIYYTHMTFDDLSTIAADIDPHSSLPYAPLNVLQAAHWSAADLKARILAAGACASSSTSPEAELGLAKSISELSPTSRRHRRNRSSRNVTPSLDHSRSRTSFTLDPASGAGAGGSIASAISALSTSSQSVMYHPVPSDDTHRIGAGGLFFTDSSAGVTRPGMGIQGIQGMPDLGPDAAAASGSRDLLDPHAHASGPKARPHPHTETTYFGLSRSSRLLPDLLSSAPAGTSDTSSQKWSKLEPFRFSVEFWDVHLLPERERVYSSTHFYAGSWFNVYVQTIRKKDKAVQLGVYLHRQAPGEPFPVPSAPGRSSSTPSASSAAAAAGLAPAGAALGLTGGAPLGRSTTGHVTVGSPRSTAGPAEPEGTRREDEAYRDSRPVNRAYFSISCASALGSALIRFSSAPDNFTLSQSWGWKSSALRSAEYLVGAQDATATAIAGAGAGVGGGQAGETLEQGVLGWVGETADLPRAGSLRASVVVGLV